MNISSTIRALLAVLLILSANTASAGYQQYNYRDSTVRETTRNHI